MAAGVVVYPGTGSIRASKFVLVESSIDSLASPICRLNARASKKVALRPVVASDSIKLSKEEVEAAGPFGRLTTGRKKALYID